MHRIHTPLSNLKKGESGRVIHIHGGNGLKRRLNTLGIREGQIVKVLSKQPMMGPLTFSIGNCHMTIGRGMAHKIIVEEL